MGTLPADYQPRLPGHCAGLCVQAVGVGLRGLAALISDESAFEVLHENALYKSTALPFYLTFAAHFLTVSCEIVNLNHVLFILDKLCVCFTACQ